MDKQIVDVVRMREVISYNAETGLFARKVRTAQCHQVGDRADFPGSGHLTGYRLIGVLGKKMPAHRVAWAYAHGEWPDMCIDHINGVKDDNRLENLRHVSRRMNTQNRRNALKGKAGTDLVGVYWHPPSKRWVARIMTNRHGIHLGMFDTAEEGHAAYIKAKRIYHEGCTQ